MSEGGDGGSARGRPRRRHALTVTIRDVAELAGVSVATVTRALHGYPSVLPETRERIEAAAAELRYRPDRLARALVTGRSKTIGLLIPSTGNPFWGELTVGLEAAAVEAGFSVLLANSRGEPDRQEQMLNLLLAHRVDGVVVAASTGPLSAWFRPGESSGPFVFVGSNESVASRDLKAAMKGSLERLLTRARDDEALRLEEARTSKLAAQVLFDDFGSARLAVRHLVEAGHTDVAHIVGPPSRPALLRVLGFRAALDEDALTGSFACSDGTLDGGRRAALELLASSPRPTAVFAYDDLVAVGAMRAAHSLGVRVPEELSIVGCDDIQIAAYTEPPLTTIKQPTWELGRTAMALLLAALDGGVPPQVIALPGALEIRASTAPPQKTSAR